MRISSGNGSSSIGRRRGASRKRDADLILNQKSILVLGMLECFCFVVCLLLVQMRYTAYIYQSPKLISLHFDNLWTCNDMGFV